MRKLEVWRGQVGIHLVPGLKLCLSRAQECPRPTLLWREGRRGDRGLGLSPPPPTNPDLGISGLGIQSVVSLYEHRRTSEGCGAGDYSFAPAFSPLHSAPYTIEQVTCCPAVLP